jgi:TrmH family RNA methyltransferase
MGERRDAPHPQFSDNLCIVLVDPLHDGNIGAVARTMLNFGIRDLRVVGRQKPWSEEVRNRAKNAQNVLEEATLHASFDEAVSDCSVVVGTSGKREGGDKTELRHFVMPEELPRRLDSIEGRVALVFGPEGKGLVNNQLRACDLLVTIPTWEGYPILNLSHAVTILCYVWFENSTEDSKSDVEERLISPKLKVRLKSEVKRLIASMPTKDHRRRGIEETLLRVIMRGLPKEDEIHRLLAVVTEAADAFERNSPKD